MNFIKDKTNCERHLSNLSNWIKDIVIFAIAIIFNSSKILVRPLNNLDEIWNFNFANCVSNGLVPYRDFNMVQTPLFSLIDGCILRFFGQELIVTRVLAILLCSGIIFLMYKIMKKLNISDFLNYIIIIFFTCVMHEYFAMDYNWATLFVLLIIIYLETESKSRNHDEELNNDECKIRNNLTKNMKKDAIIGILGGICIMLKQNTGLLISIALVGYKIFEIKDKKQIKDFLKIAIIRGLGVFIPIIVIGIYLVINGAFKDFVDYCILGVSTFSNKISYSKRILNNSDVIFRILGVMPITLIVSIIRYFIKRERNFLIISLYGLAELIIVYPISDEAHFVLVGAIILINTTYLIDYISKKIINKEEFIKKANFVLSNTIFAGVIVVTFFYAQSSINNYNALNINKEITHYSLIPMSQEQINNIKQIDNYILNLNKKVYILDAQAAIYMIPIDRYNKNYDMFLKGNLGGKGEEGQIENLKKDKEKIVLILNENYNRNWQNPEKVRIYITENMKMTGKIGIFDIYE